jgi:D-3-phosphoglycerate dehydrogenase
MRRSMCSPTNRCRRIALLKMPTVLATPHLGYVEKDSYELYFRTAFENMVEFRAGQAGQYPESGTP